MRNMENGNERTKNGKRQRAYGHKVRSGCITCKKRKVKCDETKPKCLKCQKFGRGTRCEYPDLNPPEPVPKPSTSRILIPKPANYHEIHAVPPDNKFENEQEFRSFRIFSQETSRQLAGYFESGLWSRLVLQASEASPAIRHAVIAIGALNLKTWTGISSAVEQRRREFAYHQYSLAIRRMREAASSGLTDRRSTLMISILFFCFEIFHGNNDAAVAQVHSVIRLVDEMESLRQTPHLLLPSQQSSTPIDEEITQALTRLELQIMTFDDPRSSSTHHSKTKFRQDLIDTMPRTFTSLTEAWSMLNIVQKRALHWLATFMPISFTSENRPLKFKPTFDVDPAFAQRSKILAEYQRWDAAFEPLLRKARMKEGEGFEEATSIRLQYLCGFLTAQFCACGPETWYFSNVKELREILNCVRALLAFKSKDEEGFSVETRFILPLMVVGLQRRHRKMRREAMELLEEYPMREGLWDSMLLARIIRWCSEIDEEGLGDEEFVPLEKSWQIAGIKVDRLKRTAVVSVYLPGVEVRMKETVIGW